MSAPSFTAAEQPPPQLLFLPDELVIAVLRRVRAADLCRLGRTCRRLHALADIDELWAPIALGLYQPNLNRKQQQIQSHSQQANVRYQNVRQGHETALPAHQSTDAPSNAVENAPTPIAVCDPVAAPSLALSLPAREFKRFLTSLARSQRCFRCGVDESGRETGGFADSIAEKFKRRYCKLCQTTELVTRTDAKSRYMLTNKQLARLTSVTKPWYSKDCNLYLKSHVESLAEQRRESGLVLGSAARMCSSISPSSCEGLRFEE
ncbi:hypothetical protein DFJ73DRAFT_825174 [Zopfochytrium polystomum]|nr:hypothetical protein DFJ73DRAFT_825174 [Zopfochytrium polystomum]